MRSTMMLTALFALALATPLRAERAATMADLTASYNVQQSEIQNLRDKGWSWNDIGTALAVSKRSGQPLQELVAQKDSGMSWSQIADKNGFKLSEVSRESREVAKDFKRADKVTRQAIRREDSSTPDAAPTLPTERRRPGGALTPDTGNQ